MKVNDIYNLVIDGYSKKKIVYKYSSQIELWAAEEILVNKYFIKKSKLLDIGCGAGRTTIPLHNAGYNVLGVDLCPELINRAKSLAKCFNLDVPFATMNATDLQLDDSSFHNAIFAFNGFECIPKIRNKKKALSEINRILKPGGRLIFTVHSGLPFNKSRSEFFNRLKYYLKEKSKGHKDVEFGERYFNPMIPESRYVHIPSVFKIKKLVRETGFKILLCNSEKNIVKDVRPSFLAHFHRGSIFIVAEKNIIP